MGFYANTSTPYEVKAFFMQVKNAFNPRNQFHNSDLLKGKTGYICSFYSLKQQYHILTGSTFGEPFEFCILSGETADALMIHCFIDTGPLNTWLDLLNYGEI